MQDTYIQDMWAADSRGALVAVGLGVAGAGLYWPNHRLRRHPGSLLVLICSLERPGCLVELGSVWTFLARLAVSFLGQDYHPPTAIFLFWSPS